MAGVLEEKHEPGKSIIRTKVVLVSSAAITKYHRLDTLHNKNVFSHSPGGWEFKIKVSAGLVPSEVSLLNL